MEIYLLAFALACPLALTLALTYYRSEMVKALHAQLADYSLQKKRIMMEEEENHMHSEARTYNQKEVVVVVVVVVVVGVGVGVEEESGNIRVADTWMDFAEVASRASELNRRKTVEDRQQIADKGRPNDNFPCLFEVVPIHHNTIKRSTE